MIAVCAAAAAFLRFYQLTRPGYLLGVTEYDDGVQFGDAVRLVSGVIPYRDFVVMQPPGSIVLMAPVALLAKVTGSAWGWPSPGCSPQPRTRRVSPCSACWSGTGPGALRRASARRCCRSWPWPRPG